MPKNVGRVGVDTAGGGLLTGPIVPTVIVQGAPIAVVTTLVAGHGGGPHAAAVMSTGSPNVFAGGFAVVGNGDLASCGHPLISSSTVFVN